MLAGMFLLLTGGCGTTRQSAASDETFFVPLTALPRPVETRPQASTVPAAQPQPAAKADSLLRNQRDQERRIGALTAQLERLEASRRGTRPDSAKTVPRITPPVVAPRVAATPTELKSIDEAERLYASQEYRKTIQSCQEMIQRGVDKGNEDRFYFLMGASHYRLKQFDLASVSLKKVLGAKGSTRRADASFLLGMTYRQLGMLDRAASMFDAALKESPDDALARSIRQELVRLTKNR